MEKHMMFCSICMKNVPVEEEVREENVSVLGFNVHVCLIHLIDPKGHGLYDYEVETANSKTIDEAYHREASKK